MGLREVPQCIWILVYWYRHGYLRTASKVFNLNNFENKTHLTNDAVQNKFSDYGKYEKGNKVSYE